MTIYIDSIEVVIDTEGNWNMTINIDSIDRGRILLIVVVKKLVGI